MGKLKEMVAEESSIGNSLKYNVRRFRLASIGLIHKAEQERVRLYKQLIEASEAKPTNNGLIGTVNALSTGALNLVREESQKIFEELVEAGEEATAKKSVASKPVAKQAKSQSATPKKAQVTDISEAAKAKPSSKKTAEKPAPEKETVKAPAKQKKAKAALTTEAQEDTALSAAFESAQARIQQLDKAPDQLAMLELYAFFKQASEGDVKGRRPAAVKVVERAKFDARRAIKGMSKSEAMESYIAKVEDLAK